MAESYIGEIRQFAGNFAPNGWLFCNGQLLPISENDTLFQLIGTTYGGDGQTNFALPNLQGRVPVHMGNGYVLGQMGGSENVTLNAGQMPIHSHPAMSAGTGGSDTPAGNVWGNATSNVYATPPGSANMNATSVGIAGGNQPHDNMHPYLAISYIISLYGIYPSQN